MPTKIMTVAPIVCHSNASGLTIVWLPDAIMLKISIAAWITIGSKILPEYRYVEAKNQPSVAAKMICSTVADKGWPAKTFVICHIPNRPPLSHTCLLYTSDAADEL